MVVALVADADDDFGVRCVEQGALLGCEAEVQEVDRRCAPLFGRALDVALGLALDGFAGKFQGDRPLDSAETAEHKD